ncbi:phage tail protein [Streptomyces uncialis]|uniref:phage tail protein n=1 Tax=Streptomyces uncialis TaxID=1048205 RepID=UPI0037960679
MADDVTITVRVNDQTAAGFRDVNGRLRDMQGRFAGAGGQMGTVSATLQKQAAHLKSTLISLAPAVVPVAAAMGPVAAAMGAGSFAAVAFTTALVPQIKSMSEVSGAYKKTQDAASKYGATSKQAAEASLAFQKTIADMPQETQQAAGSLLVLQESTRKWSDQVAGVTMAPVEQSFAVIGAILPKTTPLVETFGTQLARLTTLAGGAVESPGFDGLMARFSEYTDRTLTSATTRTIMFLDTLASGQADGPLADFMEYARAEGPAVQETLTNIGEAISTLLQGAAEAGPGALAVVDTLASMVAAVPPELVGTLMGVYTAFRLISLAGAGVAAAGQGLTRMTGHITAVGGAAGATTGRMAGLRGAIAGLSAGARTNILIAALAGVTLGIGMLAEKARGAPPNVDKLSSSLMMLSSSGKWSGELKATFGDMDEFISRLGSVKAESEAMEKVEPFLAFSGIGAFADDAVGALDDLVRGSDSLNAKKEDFEAFDQSMAAMAKGGHADAAAEGFKKFESALLDAGHSSKDIAKFFPEYKAAAAGLKAEQDLAARSMGLFGQQALDAKAKLDSQKSSADGLRQAIQSLNDTNLAGLGGIVGWRAAMDDASKAVAENAGALQMVNGEWDATSEGAREVMTRLQGLAASTGQAAASAREAGKPWSVINGIYSEGRDKLISLADAAGLSAEQARLFADEFLRIPEEKETRLSMRTEDAVANLDAVIAAINRTPKSKSVTVRTLTGDAVRALEGLGYTVERLPDGRFKVTSDTKSARDGLAAVKAARDAIKSKNIDLTARDKATSIARQVQAAIDNVRGKTVDLYTVRHTINVGATLARNAKNYKADGGILAFADGGTTNGGREKHVAQIARAGEWRVWAEDETGGEAYIPLAPAKRSRSIAILAEVADRFGYSLESFARGGLTKAQRRRRDEAAKKKAQAAAKKKREEARRREEERRRAEAEARRDAQGDLTISHYGRMAGYRTTEIRSDLGRPDTTGDLVRTLNQWRNTIMKGTRGGQERGLLRMLDEYGRGLIKHQQSLSKVNATLDKARDKLSDLRSAAAQLSESVRSGVLSSANITRGASTGGAVTTEGIMGGLLESRDKATAFARALKDLRGRGVATSLIQQIAEAGISGGGLETAGALLGASSSEIRTMNSLQKEIAAAARSAGRTTADAVYGPAIKHASAMVNALTKAQDRLEKAMDRLAGNIEKAVKRGLSGKAAGGVIGAATGGARGGLTWVGEQGPEIVRLPYGSTVYPAGTSRGMAAARGGAAGQPIVIQLSIGGREFGELWVDVGRREIKSRGGNVQAILAGRPA